jgi:hypothetical protein
MATQAQIEVNRRNCRQSTGPRTRSGRDRSKLNALTHGCRAEILVLPTEDPGLFEDRSRTWRLSLKPRNPAEEYMVDRMASLAWKWERIDRAQMAQLSKRVHHAGVDAVNSDHEQVITLGKRLLGDSRALNADADMCNSVTDDNAGSASDFDVVADDPALLILRLQTTVAGCEWMLDQWANLRTILDRGTPWLAADQFKAVRLLGHNSSDPLDNIDVARLYLASHVLLDQGGEPFADIMNELLPTEASRYRQTLQSRRYEDLAPKDAVAARQALVEIVDLATEQLQKNMEVLCQIAALDAASAAERASWDDSVEGERLRRYEATCSRIWLRMFDLLLKARRAGEELDFVTIASLDRFAPARTIGAIVSPAQSVTNVVTPAVEPVTESVSPIEAKPSRENAPNEANSSAQTPSSTRPYEHREFRIDTPHCEHKVGAVGINDKEKMHPALHGLLTGRKSTLPDMTPIFGKLAAGSTR